MPIFSGIVNYLKGLLNESRSGVLSLSGRITYIDPSKIIHGLNNLRFTGSVSASKALNSFTRSYSSIAQILTGTLSRTIDLLTRSYLGTIHFTGSLTRLIDNLTRPTSGTSTFTGWIYGQKSGVPQILERLYGGLGVLSSVLYKAISKSATGTLQFATNLIYFRIANKTVGLRHLIFSGTVSRVSSTIRTYSADAQILTGIVTHLINQVTKLYTGNQTFTGAITRTIDLLTRSKSGSFQFTTSLTRLIDNLTRPVSGTATFWGWTYGQKFGGGQVLERLYSGLGILSGAIFKAISKAKDGTIHFTGSYVWSWNRLRTYSSSMRMNGTVTPEVIIEVLYLGIKNPV